MQPLNTIIILLLTLMSACSNNVNQRLYEGIKRQNEVNKSPVERAMTPAPSYDAYRKERDSLKKKAPSEESGHEVKHW